MELLRTLTMDEAKGMVEAYFQHFQLKVEKLPLLQCIHRVVAEEILAPIDVPSFDRSTVDGYALLAKDTFGASESLPSFLEVVGSVDMGQVANIDLKPGECCYVPTGGMLPRGCDGVVMIEYTEALDEHRLCVQKPIAPGENVLKQGDDVARGSVVFQRGHVLRPQDIGVLAGMGYVEVPVFEKIRVGIISTGDELVAPGEEISPGQIKDMNTYSLAAALLEDGCEVVDTGVVKDEKEPLKKKLEAFLERSDIVLISGGSSMGAKDITKDVIHSLGEPGVFIHGIAVKPGKPTIVGKVGGKMVFGLPGQPVSALLIYRILVGFLIRRIYKDERPRGYIRGKMAVNIPSAPGKEHYVMVNIEEVGGEVRVMPVHGKSGMLTMMTKSVGYIKIHTNQEGIEKGEDVEVYLF